MEGTTVRTLMKSCVVTIGNHHNEREIVQQIQDALPFSTLHFTAGNKTQNEEEGDEFAAEVTRIMKIVSHDNPGGFLRLNVVLEGLSIGPKGMLGLAPILLSNKPTGLFFNNNKIRDEGCSFLCARLLEYQRLSELHVKDNQITEKGLRVLKMTLQTNKTLKILSFDEEDALSTSSQRILHEVKEFLTRNFVAAEISEVLEGKKNEIAVRSGVFHLQAANIIQKSNNLKNLKSLVLSSCQMDDEVCGALFDQVCDKYPAIEYLDLSSNRIASLGTRAVGKFLEAHFLLSTLLLQDNRINSSALNELIVAISKNKSLQILDVSNNRIGDALLDIEPLYNVTHTSMKILRIGKNSFLDERYIQPLFDWLEVHNVEFDATGTIVVKKPRGGHFKPNLEGNIVRLVCLGSTGVGAKTSFIQKFVYNKYPADDDYNPFTHDQSFNREIEVEGKKVIAALFDTSGEEDYNVLTRGSIERAHGFILGFSVNSVNSFEEVSHFHQLILNTLNTSDYPKILIGHKCDLRPQDRQVTKFLAMSLAEKLGCPYLETSSLANINIDEAVAQAISQVWRFALVSPPSSRKNSENDTEEKDPFKNIVSSIEKDVAEILALHAQQQSVAVLDAEIPSVLITGRADADQRRLVQAILGTEFPPTSQKFSFLRSEKEPLVVIKAVELQDGTCQLLEYKEDIQEVLDHLNAAREVSMQVHAVWYVINAVNFKFTAADKKACESFWRPSGDYIPLLILLQNADELNDDELAQLEDEIRKFMPANCEKIFRVNTLGNDPAISNSELIRTSGLDQVIAHNLRLFYLSCRDCYVQVQLNESKALKSECLDIIVNCANQLKVQGPQAAYKIVEDFMCTSADIFGFKKTSIDPSIRKIVQNVISSAKRGELHYLVVTMMVMWALHLQHVLNVTIRGSKRGSSTSLLEVVDAIDNICRSLQIELGPITSQVQYKVAGDANIEASISTAATIIASKLNEVKDVREELNAGNQGKAEQLLMLQNMITSFVGENNELLMQGLFQGYSRVFPLLSKCEIFQTLVSNFPVRANAKAPPQIRLKQIRISAAVIYWLTSYLEDFENERDLVEEVKQFAGYLRVSDMKEAADDILGALSRRSEDIQETTPSTVGLPYLLHWEPRVIASILTEVDFELFKKISLRDFFHPKNQSQSVYEMTKRFNLVSAWTASCILQEEGVVRRAQVLSFFIKIAHACVDSDPSMIHKPLNNFHGFFAIMSGLESTPIYRLKHTWARLSPQMRSTFEKLKLLCDPTGGSYGELLRRLDTCTRPCVPYIGSFMTWVLKSVENLLLLPDKLESANKRLTMEAEVKRKIQLYQQGSFDTVVIADELRKFMNYLVIVGDEDAQYKLSLQLEPREGKTLVNGE